MRAYLTSCEDLTELIENENDDMELVVHAKVFPLEHHLASVWVFVGAIVPMEKEEVFIIAESTVKHAEALARTKKRMLETVKKDLARGKGKGKKPRPKK